MSDNAKITKIEELLMKKFDEIAENFERIDKSIKTAREESNANFSSLDKDISTIRSSIESHDDRIQKLETANNHTDVSDMRIELEILKQDRLVKNLRFTGLPNVAFSNPVDTIMSIAQTLEISAVPSDLMAYADRNNSSIIVSFASYYMKRQFMDSLRERKSLLVEEVFSEIQSNSLIYANDQLTPYFANLFKIAWSAKKNGQLITASSTGGKIRVRKAINHVIRTIFTEAQLYEVNNESADAIDATTSNQQHGDNISRSNGNNCKQSQDSNKVHNSPKIISLASHQQVNKGRNRTKQTSKPSNRPYSANNNNIRQNNFRAPTKRSNRDMLDSSYSDEDRTSRKQNNKKRNTKDHQHPTYESHQSYAQPRQNQQQRKPRINKTANFA